MINFDGETVMVAGLEMPAVELFMVSMDLSVVLIVRGTTVTIEEVETARCGDLAIDTGIMVILVGVLAGDIGNLVICKPDLVGVPGIVAMTALPADRIVWGDMVIVFVGVCEFCV